MKFSQIYNFWPSKYIGQTGHRSKTSAESERAYQNCGGSPIPQNPLKSILKLKIP